MVREKYLKTGKGRQELETLIPTEIANSGKTPE
jgi:hypothetical protein